MISLLVLLLVGLLVARTLFTRYLHSEAFRRSLGEGAANALHASRAEFSPLEFDGALVYGENFQATREDGGGFSSINADLLRASFDWHGLLHHTVQVDEMSIQRLTIEPPVTRAALPGNNLETPAPLVAGRKGWTVDLRKAVISQANWHWSNDPVGGITGAAVTLSPTTDGAWLIDAQGGTARQTGWPALDIESASMRWQAPTLYINSSTLRNGPSRMNVTGSVETRQSLNLLVQFDGVDVQPLLTSDWRERLAGLLTGQANVQATLGVGEQGNAGHDVTISGTASLVSGRLTALPILDQIGVFTHTERFRQLDLTRASAEFTRTADQLDVRNLVVESAGLIRVEGAYTVRNGEIAGDFKVGLTPATLQWIPGSQEEVFTDSRAGYWWTNMKLSGPAAHPNDDLTPRLVAATGNGVIKDVQGVESTVKKAAQSALDLLLH